jgi:hypothetical protein
VEVLGSTPETQVIAALLPVMDFTLIPLVLLHILTFQISVKIKNKQKQRLLPLKPVSLLMYS